MAGIDPPEFLDRHAPELWDFTNVPFGFPHGALIMDVMPLDDGGAAMVVNTLNVGSLQPVVPNEAGTSTAGCLLVRLDGFLEVQWAAGTRTRCIASGSGARHPDGGFVFSPEIPSSGKYFDSVGNTVEFPPGTRAAVVRVSPSGKTVWSQEAISSAFIASGTAVGPAGTVGYFGLSSSSVTLGSITLDDDLGGEVGDGRMFLLSAEGEPLWGASIRGAGESKIIDAVIDATGSIYAIATVTGAATYHGPVGDAEALPEPKGANGEVEAIVFRLSSGGALAWAIRLGGEGVVVPTDLQLDAKEEHLVVGGLFGGSILVDGTKGSQLLVAPSGSARTVFAIRLLVQGVVDWAHEIGGDGTVSEAGFFPRRTSLVIESSGAIVMGGTFDGNATFGPTVPTQLTSEGQDGFLVRFNSADALQCQ